MSGGTSFSIYNLVSSGVGGVAFSPDQKLVYAAVGGQIRVFDVATHALVATWNVGKDLGAVSVSPDGAHIVATELQSNGTSKAYVIDTATGAAVSAGETGDSFLDAQMVDDHTAILTGGQNQIQVLDLDTMKYSDLQGGISYSNSSILSHDGHLTLFAETGISDGPLFVYDDRIGQIVASGDDYQHGSGFNVGTQAISEAAGQIAQFIYYSAVFVYDLNVDFQFEVDFAGPLSGIAYDESGDYVYVLQNGELDKLDTDHWKLVTKYTGIGGGGYNQPFADSLMVDSTDSYIVIKNGSGGVDLVDLSAANATYKGTSGADAFAGGDGNDTYNVNNIGDVVTEKAGEGYDKVKAGVDYALSANVEELDLTGAAVSGTGNAQDNVIVGNLQANWLDGLTGDDLLSGGKGDDHLIGGVGSDTLLGGAGADTLDGGDNTDTASYADATRGVKVDLSITEAQNTKGGGVDLLVSIENLIGSSHDDILIGGAGPNQLDGGAGDDILIGGANPDRLIGGEGSDTFRFLVTGDSHDNQIDTIVDLTADDRIDLSAIDADTSAKGNQAFTLVSYFDGHAGQAVLMQGDAYTTLLELDVNGDQHADMVIKLVGDQMDFSNFVL